MFPAIALMIGAYIVTRMVELIFSPDRATIVKFFAFVATIVVVICLKDVTAASTRMFALPPLR